MDHTIDMQDRLAQALVTGMMEPRTPDSLVTDWARRLARALDWPIAPFVAMVQAEMDRRRPADEESPFCPGGGELARETIAVYGRRAGLELTAPGQGAGYEEWEFQEWNRFLHRPDGIAAIAAVGETAAWDLYRETFSRAVRT